MLFFFIDFAHTELNNFHLFEKIVFLMTQRVDDVGLDLVSDLKLSLKLEWKLNIVVTHRPPKSYMYSKA